MSWGPNCFSFLLQATPRGTFGYSTRQYSVSDHFYTARSVYLRIARSVWPIWQFEDCPFVKQIYLLLAFLSSNLFRYWQASEKL